MPSRSKPTPTPDFLSRLSVAKEPEKGGKGKKDQVLVAVCGLETYGAFHRVGKEIEEGFKATYGQPIKDGVMFPHFIAEGVALGRCPENFKGHEGLCGDDTSLQLKKKPNTTVLKPEQVERFHALEIEIEHNVLAPHTLRVKPEVFGANTKLMNEMLECLSKNGFDIDEIFETQLPNERWIVAEKTLDSLFAKAKEAREKLAANPKVNLPCNFTDADIRELLEICASVSIGPKWTGTFAEAFEMVRKIVAPTEAEQAAALAAAAKTKRRKAA